MSLKLQIILLILLIIVFFVLVCQVKKKKIDLRYTLSWLVLIVILIILVCFPNILEQLSNFFGIELPANMVFFCGFCFSLVIIYTLTNAVSKMSDNIRQLSQKIALLEKEFKDNFKE